MKNPLTLAGIEPATFRFVAQHITTVPPRFPIINGILLYLNFMLIIRKTNIFFLPINFVITT